MDRGVALPQPRQSNPLLSVVDGIGTVSIDGPILRKPDVFARVLLGATSSEDIGAALREAGQSDDIKAVFLDIDSPGGTVAGTPELAATVASIDLSCPIPSPTSKTSRSRRRRSCLSPRTSRTRKRPRFWL